MLLFLPTVSSYHLLTSDLFLNVAAADAAGFEKGGNFLLSPFQYLFAGRIAAPQQDGSWRFIQRFDYHEGFWIKTGMSVFLAVPSCVLGSACKGLGFLSSETRARHLSLTNSKLSTSCKSNLEQYKTWGIPTNSFLEEQIFTPQGYERRRGDEEILKDAKEALAEIGEYLTEAQILWWVDCGTCLGMYRYGGIIPWDSDIDLGILAIDFENARRALNRLDKSKYHVQDWSSRSFPDTFFKIYVKTTQTIIDIFCFRIDPERREISSIFTLEEALFFPEWFKARERPFSVPASFDIVFPLKKGMFDGVAVFVPNQTKQYLQRLYGENLEPVKIYHPKTGRYEKDLSHPYWTKPHVH